MSKRNQLMTASSLLLLATCFAGSAMAQATDPDASVLDDVVVTANKREQNVQEVPSQVTALSGDLLSKLNARSLEEFAGFVPGLAVQSANPGTNLISIRGTTTGAQASSAVGIYLDDVPIGSSNSFAGGYRSLSLTTFALDRVEVLSGPQGTLYGANSLGGAIKYVTARPSTSTTSFMGEVEGSTTDHGAFNHGLRGSLNLALVPDRVGLRVTATDQFDSGYVDDPTHGRKNQGNARIQNVRGSLLANVTDRLTVQLNGFSQRVHNVGVNTVLRDASTDQPIGGEYDQSYALPQSSVQTLDLASATATLDLGFATLTSVTAYQRSDFDSASDATRPYSGLLGGLLGAAALTNYRVNTGIVVGKTTQELRLTSPNNDHFEWIVGGFYTKEDGKTFTDVRNDNDPNGRLLGLQLFQADIPTSYEEASGYADGTLYFTPRFDLTLGVRYSRNEQSVRQDSIGLFNSATAPFTLTSRLSSSKESVTTYLINPRFRVNDNVMVYARAASGYRPGGPNYVVPGLPGGSPPTFEADTLWTYEAGTRITALDRRLTLNATVYQSDWSDIQLQVTRNGIASLENAGDARIRGAELGAIWQPASSLRLTGSLSYTDAELTTAAPSLGVNYTGARLPLSPEWAFAAGVDYFFRIKGRDARVSLSDRYSGDRTNGFAGSTVSPLYNLDAYHLVDADLSVALTPSVDIDFYAKNLFNEKPELVASLTDRLYVANAPTSLSLGRPLTVGAKVSFRY